MTDKQAKISWLDKPRNIDHLVHALWVLCALLVAAEFFYHKHAELGFDGWFAFYPVFGFVAYCCIVLGAKQLRRVLKRDEDYYGEAEPEVKQQESSKHD